MAKRIVETLVTELTADGAKLRSEMDKSLKDAKTWGDKLSKISNNVALFGAAGGVAIGGGLVALTKNSIDNADAMSKQAQAVGMAIEKLSAYIYVAEMGGVEQEKFVASLGKFNRVIAEAFQGVGGGVDAFDALGISITDSNGKLKNNSDLFAEVADRFKIMPDGIEKSALAMDLFGSSGADLIPVLNGGKQSLVEMTAEAERLGLVISEDTGKKAELFNDNLEKMEKAFVGLGNRIAVDALPSLNNFTDIINDPKTQQSLADIATGIIDIAAALIKATSASADFFKFWSKEISARNTGDRGDDIDLQIKKLNSLEFAKGKATFYKKMLLGDTLGSVDDEAIQSEIDKTNEKLKTIYSKQMAELNGQLLAGHYKEQMIAANQKLASGLASGLGGSPGIKSGKQKEDEKNAEKVSPVYDPFLDDNPYAQSYEDFQKEQEAADRSVEIQREKFRRIHEEKLLAQGLDAEVAEYQHSLAKEELAKELESLREKNLLTTELESEFKTAELEMEEAHQARLKEIKDRAVQEDLHRQLFQLQAAEQLFGSLYDLSAEFGGKQSRLTRALFAFQKVASIAQAGLAIKSGIAKAADEKWPMNLVAMASVVAQTGGIVSDMKAINIAHGGLDSVPKESTYLLDQGERVVSPRQNKDLTEFLKDGGNKKAVTVNVINQAGDAKVDVRETANGIDVIVSKVVDKIKDGIARGNGIDTTLRGVYPQLIRRGS
jgi:hypothetical protein